MGDPIGLRKLQKRPLQTLGRGASEWEDTFF